MTQKAIDRLSVIQQVVNRQLRQREAAVQLGLSIRQVKRLVARFRQEGPPGLVSRHLGRRPGNALSKAVRQEIMGLVHERYADFGPTLACEKLVEQHGYRLSVETLRQWMIAEGLWKPKKRKAARIHQRRPRRPCPGELVQIDGSPHDWFEGRGPCCTLIVFIDDATSKLMALHFVPAETTWAYLQTLRVYLAKYGRPVALYSDKHSIFRVNYPEREGELTQFTRALKTLDIEPIHANTPQAKGRVERANQTLQDRLVKELRLAGISDIEAANAFLLMAIYSDPPTANNFDPPLGAFRAIWPYPSRRFLRLPTGGTFEGVGCDSQDQGTTQRGSRTEHPVDCPRAGHLPQYCPQVPAHGRGRHRRAAVSPDAAQTAG